MNREITKATSQKFSKKENFFIDKTPKGRYYEYTKRGKKYDRLDDCAQHGNYYHGSTLHHACMGMGYNHWKNFQKMKKIFRKMKKNEKKFFQKKHLTSAARRPRAFNFRAARVSKVRAHRQKLCQQLQAFIRTPFSQLWQRFRVGRANAKLLLVKANFYDPLKSVVWVWQRTLACHKKI